MSEDGMDSSGLGWGQVAWYLWRYFSGFRERWEIYSAFFSTPTVYFCFHEIERYCKTTRLGNESASAFRWDVFVQLGLKAGTDPVPKTMGSITKKKKTSHNERVLKREIARLTAWIFVPHEEHYRKVG
jgi:hypothetical protein